MNGHTLPAEVLAALALILVVARAAGALARRLGQPAVVGEIAAGLALGPSLLGLFPGNLPDLLFPVSARPVLSTIAQLGLVLFMFLIGLEADTSLVRGQAKIAVTVSLSSILAPFLLGIPLALLLWHDHATSPGRLPFVLFIGASLSITAFPVLARVLAERRMDRIPLGALALATASLDDVIAWSLLALVVAIVVGGGAAGAVAVMAGAVLFTVFVGVVVRPLMTKAFARANAGRGGQISTGAFALVLAGVLICAWCTDRIGVHLVFGAFAFGVFFPADPDLRESVAHKVEAVTVLLLPVFFVVTGLDVNLGNVGLAALGELAFILVVAVAGKVGGAFLAARAFGLDTRRALALGVLANTRGLTELVILGIGRQLGVLDGSLFSLLVVMALVTTAMAGPLLDRVYPRRLVDRDLATAQRAAAGAMTVLTALPAAPGPRFDPAWGSLLAVSKALAASARDGHVMLSRVLPLPSGPAAAAALTGPLATGPGGPADGAAGGGLGGLAALTAELDHVAQATGVVASPGIIATENVVRADDATAETRRQAQLITADWLVATADLAQRPSDSGWPADVVVVDPGPTPAMGPVQLTSATPVAWEVAVRLAQATKAPLQVVTTSGARQLIDLARRVGVAASSSVEVPPAVVVCGADDKAGVGPPATGPDGGQPVVTVRAYPGGARRAHGLTERSTRIPDGRTQAAVR